MSLDVEGLKRVSALFDEWHELAPGQRALRLTELQNEAPEVAAELVRWLAQDELPHGALDVLTQRFQSHVEAAPTAPDDRSGLPIGAYELLCRVGRGGMGEVYEARRPGADFEQRVAIKLLRRGLDSEDVVRRFLRERRILAQLEHPGIARLIDGGMSEDGLPYLVMEFVDGSTLIEAAKARDLDLAARLQIFLQICDAVAYAHRRLIVHRDLKPSNVLLTPDNQPKLLDFGIAKLLDDVGDEGLTGTGMRVLTPGYAAPEQILGLPISTSTDVYALGVILYELLTGASPHQRFGKTLERVTSDIHQESVIRPSTALMKADETGNTTRLQRLRLARQLSGDLDTIILHALKREPDRRYQGAAEFADDIRRYRNGHPVRAESDTMGYRLRKFVKRHRGGVTAASLAVLGIVAGLVIALWQADLARQSATHAALETSRAQAQAHRAEVIKDFFASMFENSSPMRQRQGAQLTAREWVESAADRIDTELRDAPEAQAEIRVALGWALLEFGADAKATALLNAALVYLRKVGSADAESLSNALQLLSRVQRERGDLEGAQRTIVEALSANERIADPELRIDERLQLRTYQMTLANARGQPELALQIGRALLADRTLRYGENDPHLAVDWNNLGATLNKLDRPQEAEAALSRALTLLRADPESPAARQANVIGGLCLSQLGQGKLAAALASAKQAQEIASRSLGSHSYVTQRAQSCAARALRYLGHDDRAWSIINVLRTEVTESDPDLRRVVALQRGVMLLSKNHIEEAVAILSAVRTAFAKEAHSTPLYAIEADLAFAHALARAGNTAQALSIASVALQALESQASGGYRKGELLVSAARAFALSGHAERAQSLRTKGLALWRTAWAASDTVVPEPMAP